MLKIEKRKTPRAKGRKVPRRRKTKLKTTDAGITTRLVDRIQNHERSDAQREALLRGLRTTTRENTSRLEARIPTSVYEVMEHAAALRGLTMTAYITATMGEDARRTIEQTALIRLSRADQVAFAEALINPPPPNDRLIAAAKRHAPMVRK